MRDGAFDSEWGSLVWSRDVLQSLWKRGKQVYRDKLCQDLKAFMQAPECSDSSDPGEQVRHAPAEYSCTHGCMAMLLDAVGGCDSCPWPPLPH